MTYVIGFYVILHVMKQFYRIRVSFNSVKISVIWKEYKVQVLPVSCDLPASAPTFEEAFAVPIISIFHSPLFMDSIATLVQELHNCRSLSKTVALNFT
jgi:hypothetical protein